MNYLKAHVKTLLSGTGPKTHARTHLLTSISIILLQLCLLRLTADLQSLVFVPISIQLLDTHKPLSVLLCTVSRQ